MSSDKIAIIGGGNMGVSLIGGLIANGYAAKNIIVSDHDAAKLRSLESQFHVSTTHNNLEAIGQADIVIFAVKPQILKQVATELADLIQQRKPLIISIAAGIRESSLQQWLGGNVAIVRAMPNTPALIGCGASGLYSNPFTSLEQRQAAESVLRAVGLVVWVENESLMDAVTALSGSGPAYFFLVMEILQQAGEQMGLPKDIARLLTLQTAFGAARMALDSKEHASELRLRVTSPGGTTEKAINTLEQKKLREIFTQAVLAAEQRGKELADQLGT